MARPKIEIDVEQFRKLCAIQCTLSEIAGWFRCSEDTIERWCKRELNQSFADAYKIYSVDGKISIRRIQFRIAEHNPAMAMFLGKVYLGQREAQQVEITTAPDDETIKRMHEYFSAASNDINQGEPD